MARLCRAVPALANVPGGNGAILVPPLNWYLELVHHSTPHPVILLSMGASLAYCNICTY